MKEDGSGTAHRARHEYSKVLDHTFAIEEVVGCDKEVPAESSKPRQLMRLVDDIPNGDDLVETFDLNQKNLKIQTHNFASQSPA